MKEDRISGASSISRLDFKLWKEYLEIAHEFWLPQSLASKRRFLIMLSLLMAFVASLLFAFAAAFVYRQWPQCRDQLCGPLLSNRLVTKGPAHLLAVPL